MGSRGSVLFALAAWAGAACATSLADYDGDGIADVLLQHADGSWRYHAILGAAVTRAEDVRLTREPAFHWAGTGDFNGDGRDDVLLRRADGAWFYYPLEGHQVVVDQRGWANLPRNLGFRVVAVADLNHDGRDDVLLRRPDGAWLYAPMDGRRVIGAERGWANLPRHPDWRLAGSGDFDGDGRDDVLLRHINGAWHAFAMDGNRVFARSTPTFLPANPNWHFAGIADFDGDRRDDVLLRHANGAWRYWVVDRPAASGVTSAGVRLDRDWAWRLGGIGDGDGDGQDDVLLRNDDGRWRWYGLDGHRIAQRAPSTLPRDPDWMTPTRPVHIPDDILRAALTDALGKEPNGLIQARELRALNEFRAQFHPGIRDLTGIEYATGLWWITLRDQGLENIEPLAGLVKLRVLYLQRNRIQDATALAGLRNMEVLVLADNAIVDVSPLARMSAMTALFLKSNAIEDISPLTRLTALELLDLDHNNVADIAAVEHFTRLDELGLAHNAVSDLTPIAGLAALETLRLSGNNIKDISPLAGLARLRILALDHNSVADIGPLAPLKDLEELALAHNRVSELTPLRGSTGLVRLDLDHNSVADLGALEGLANLEELGLAHNAVSDLAPITELTALVSLRLEGNDIEDVSPLADFTELEILNLDHNRVTDIAALGNLTNLDEVRLAYNRITDLSALANNPGLGPGDLIDVRGNPLSEESLTTDVAALTARGIRVRVDKPPGLEFVHDDTVVVLRVEHDLASQTLYNGLRLDLYAQTLYAHFDDAFDFLMFFTNLDTIHQHDNARYYGVYSPVRNDTAGIGRSIFYTNRYGSPEKLKGVMHFPYNQALLYGPSLHELHHAWSNYAIPTAVRAHWGFSSANGQLGGFDIANLVELGDGRYAAGRFGTFANGGNRPAYSPIELYFAGYLPPEEVPDLWVAEDGEWVVEGGSLARTDDGDPVFSARDVRTYSIADIVAEHGERVPSMADAQWHFRVGVVLLIDAAHPASPLQLNRLRDHADSFSHQGSSRRPHNYFEATRGRGSVTMRGLAALRKSAPGAVADLPRSFGVVPEPSVTTLDGRCLPMSAVPGE